MPRKSHSKTNHVTRIAAAVSCSKLKQPLEGIVMNKKIKMNDEDYPTTGHEWDGIREYDKPMPRWWLWTFSLNNRFRDWICDCISCDSA